MVQTSRNSSTISIIVPVYNTFDYLEDCIKSIVKQTYSNLEILIIDDGSTDGSLDLSRKFAKQDSRISVISKKNGGVSSARNLGIKKSSGHYITFVDSDDRISPDLIKLLYGIIKKNDCDIAICGAYNVSENTEVIDDSIEDIDSKIDNETAISRILYQKGIDNAVFAKLYKKCLFDSILFNTKISYGEDLDVNYKLFKNAKYVAISSAKKYYYLKRQGSAMNSQFSKKKMDSLLITESIYEESKKMYPKLLKASELKQFIEALFLLWQIPKHNSQCKNYRSICTSHINRFKYSVLFNRNAKIQHRLYAMIAVLNVNLVVNLLQTKNRFKEKHYDAHR